MRLHSLLQPMSIRPPATGGTPAKMPDCPAPSQGSFQASFRRYIPLSAPLEGVVKGFSGGRVAGDFQVGLCLGQGSGSGQTRLQRRPLVRQSQHNSRQVTL